MRAKSKSKIRIIFLMMLLLVFTFTSLVFSPVLHARTNEETISNEQPRYIPTIDDNFKDDRVIVTLNQSYSVVNREVLIEDFKINAE